MRSRIQLRDLLLKTTGINNWVWDTFSFVNGVIGKNIYYQPPKNANMQYPCIVYGHQNYRIEHANNSPYVGYKQYLVTIIDKNPDSEYPDKMLDLPFCRFDRHYSSDNLHHWVYSLYY